MSVSHRQGRRKLLRRGEGVPPQTTILTPGSFKILLTKPGITGIANNISKITKKKLQRDELRTLIEFIRRLPETQFYKTRLGDAQRQIATMFVSRHRVYEESITEEGDLQAVTGLDDITPDGGMTEYNRKEIMQYTTNENQFKHTAHHDRRGNAFVDHDRVVPSHATGTADRTTPSGVKNKWSLQSEAMVKMMYKTMLGLGNFVKPESIDDRFQRSRQYWLTYQSITLPHQLVHFDSRHRLLNHNEPGEYKWYLHAAGFPGQFGNNQLRDTLREIVSIKICPFWMPVKSINHDYFSKIHMTIKEFEHEQSASIIEFLDPKECKPLRYGYHFALEIDREERNRVFLKPVCDTFIFRKPHARVEEITINFRAPYEFIELEDDRLIFDVTPGNPTIFTTSIAGDEHKLATGDLVYVINWLSTPSNTNLDDLINRSKGYICVRLSPTQISIPVDTTGFNSDQVKIIFGSKRISFQIDFTSLEH
jgi:hypothetical protein